MDEIPAGDFVVLGINILEVLGTCGSKVSGIADCKGIGTSDSVVLSTGDSEVLGIGDLEFLCTGAFKALCASAVKVLANDVCEFSSSGAVDCEVLEISDCMVSSAGASKYLSGGCRLLVANKSVDLLDGDSLFFSSESFDRERVIDGKFLQLVTPLDILSKRDIVYIGTLDILFNEK